MSLPSASVTQQDPFSTIMTPAAHSNGPKTHSPRATSGTFPTSTASSSQALPHPRAPREMFTDHLMQEADSNPNLAGEMQDTFGGDAQAYGESRWRGLGSEQKAIWTDRYESEMLVFTRNEDARKRERRMRHRGAGPAADGADDVEMAEAVEGEGVEGGEAA